MLAIVLAALPTHSLVTALAGLLAALTSVFTFVFLVALVSTSTALLLVTLAALIGAALLAAAILVADAWIVSIRHVLLLWR